MHALRVVFCLGIAIAVCSSALAARMEDETALRKIKEIDWPQAYREQDAELLNRILADEFRMIDAEGVWSSKAEELQYVRKHKPSYDSFRFIIKRLEIFENDSAVVAGTGVITDAEGAKRVVTKYQSTNFFIKRDGRWQAIASHISGVKETRQADAVGSN